MKKILVGILLCALLFTMTGCYFRREVATNQAGILMDDGVSISSVVGPGRYTNMGFYADIERLDTSTKTTVYVDNDVWTRDKQIVTFEVGVSYARKTDEDSVRLMWSKYNNEAKNDEALAVLVNNRIPRSIKKVTTQYSLDEMLGIGTGQKNRQTMSTEIFDNLSQELDLCGIRLIDLGVNNIEADESYTSKQKEKATASIEVEVAKENTKKLEEKLNQEKAQTEIDMEIARRNNAVAEEEAKVLKSSPEAFEIMKLEALGNVLKDTDKVYFVPAGTDLTMIMSGQDTNQNITPITVQP